MPSSVIEFGCGRGSWLSIAETLGSKRLIGLDGAWITPEQLCSSAIEFRMTNLEEPIKLDGRYDLAISLEVAEHLSIDRAPSFISDLCMASDVVLFSAAIKYQGGTSHIHERWQSYWINLFAERQYECFDIFRGRLWNHAEVEWWYRQNIFLFVHKNFTHPAFDRCRLNALILPISNIVHPQHYEAKMLEFLPYKHMVLRPTLRFCAGIFKRYLWQTFKIGKRP